MKLEDFLHSGQAAQRAVDEAIAGSSPAQLEVFRQVHSDPPAEPITVRCPFCFAKAGFPCVGKRTGKAYRAAFHTARITAAQTASAEEREYKRHGW